MTIDPKYQDEARQITYCSGLSANGWNTLWNNIATALQKAADDENEAIEQKVTWIMEQWREDRVSAIWFGERLKDILRARRERKQ